MILYRILDKTTGKFLAGIRCYDGQLVMTESGVFYKKISTIIDHLNYIAGEYNLRKKFGLPLWQRFGNTRSTRNSRFCTSGDYETCEVRTDYRRLKRYRVVISRIGGASGQVVDASTFIRKTYKK